MARDQSRLLEQLLEASEASANQATLSRPFQKQLRRVVMSYFRQARADAAYGRDHAAKLKLRLESLQEKLDLSEAARGGLEFDCAKAEAAHREAVATLHRLEEDHLSRMEEFRRMFLVYQRERAEEAGAPHASSLPDPPSWGPGAASTASDASTNTDAPLDVAAVASLREEHRALTEASSQLRKRVSKAEHEARSLREACSTWKEVPFPCQFNADDRQSNAD